MTAKILVVDDEASLERLIKQRFRRQIRAKELEFIFASNGIECISTPGKGCEFKITIPTGRGFENS